MKATDQAYLLNDQYRNASNLNVRGALHERFGTEKINWHRWVFDQFELPADARILEIGCGPGMLWLQNLDRIPPSWSITLSDLSPGMVSEARANLENSRAFTFDVFDSQEIPLPADAFDAVIANHMLYHVPDRTKTYTEVRRVLKAGGRFYSATNGRDNMRQVAELGADLGIEAGLARFTMAYQIEDAELELPAWFDDVSLRRREEPLMVTEAHPLVDYVLSGINGPALSDNQVRRLKERIEAEIAQHGAFRIDKIAGLFIAQQKLSQ